MGTPESLSPATPSLVYGVDSMTMHSASSYIAGEPNRDPFAFDSWTRLVDLLIDEDLVWHFTPNARAEAAYRKPELLGPLLAAGVLNDSSEFFGGDRVERYPQAAWVSIEHEPVVAAEHLDERSTLTTVMSVTYRVRR